MSNVLRPSYVGYRMLVSPDALTLVEAYGKHTIAHLDYRFEDSKDYLLPPENTPVMVDWGTTPLNVRQFYGYVNHYETVRDEDSANAEVVTRVVLVGSSKPMNSAHGGNWTNTTRSSIVRDIAIRHRMRSVIHPHHNVVESWAAGARSDIQILRALADEIGYRVWVDSATVYFLDPLRLLATANTLDTPTFREEDILSSKVEGGVGVPRGGRIPKRRVVYGLDSATNEMFSSTYGDKGLAVEMLDAPVNTYSQAEILSEMDSRASSEYFHANVVVRGNSRVHPGAIVSLDSDPVSRDRGGLWVVNETKHHITDTVFSTRLVVSRNRDGSVPIRTRTTLRNAHPIGSAVVRDGTTWEATLQEHVNV